MIDVGEGLSLELAAQGNLLVLYRVATSEGFFVGLVGTDDISITDDKNSIRLSQSTQPVSRG